MILKTVKQNEPEFDTLRYFQLIHIAKDMLTVYGMSDSLGPISLKVDDPYELQIFGDKLIGEVGNQIQILVDNAYVNAQKILVEHLDILHDVAKTLIEKEKITSEEFEEFFK